MSTISGEQRSAAGLRLQGLGRLLACVWLLGCSDPTVDDWPDVVVLGRVTAAGGASLPGARVEITARRPACGSDIFTQLSVTSDASGGFRAVFNHPAGRFQGCVQVRVVPAAGAAQGEWSAEYPSLDIDASSGIGEVDLGTITPPAG